MHKKVPVYCYKIADSSFHEFESVYSAIKTLLNGDTSVSKYNAIRTSCRSDNKRKASAFGYVWFYKQEGIDIVPTSELFLALNYRYATTNHKGNVDWSKLRKAHAAKRTPIIAYDDNGEELYYNSLVEAAEDFGTPKSNIARVLTNQNKGDSSHHLGKKRLTAAGWYWRYA